jgi:hypothetical protein
MEELWRRTQQPELHERWDLRFSDIDYLPRPCNEAAQRFRYATRIGFGLCIRGAGESTGSKVGPAGERTSALHFWSDDAMSLIREGSGYWRYVPTNGEIRFLTWYSYRTRCGILGRALDVSVFRPLMGWATAWSFDRLRLWIEKEIDPSVSMQRSLVHAAARSAIALVFLYQGLVPKLLYRHPSELALLGDTGMAPRAASLVLILLGIAEVLFGAFVLVAWRTRWPFAATFALMLAALVGVAVGSPHALTPALNPVTLNLSMAALAMIGWMASKDLPSAAHCLRAPPHATV